MESPLRIKGSVLSRFTVAGIAGLKIEAWDKDQKMPDAVGVAHTDSRGQFEIFVYEAYYKDIFESRKPGVYFKVFNGNVLICSTESSAPWRATLLHHQVTISVDLLPDRKRTRSPSNGFIVRGRVAISDGSPVAGLSVVAADKIADKDGLDSERLLGSTFTDAAGHYAIHYTVEELADVHKGSADLVVRVYDGKSLTPVASSPLILNALAEETINLSIGEEPYRGRSEYDVVRERLEPLLSQRKSLELAERDLAHLGNKTRLTLEQVQYYAESQTLSRSDSIDAAILYGLFRVGMPHSLAALTVQDPPSLHSALRLAQEKNIIAPLSSPSEAEAVQRLRALGAKKLLDKDSPSRVQAAALLELAGLSTKERATFLDVYTAQPGQSGVFWEAIKKTGGIGKEKTERLQRAFAINSLSLGHMPLVEKLFAKEDMKSIRDLAVLSLEDWKRLLREQGVSAPARMPGKDITEKRANYALTIVRLLEDAFPTTVFANRWSLEPSLDREVAGFFERNPDFAFESQGIDTYLKENTQALTGVEDKPAAIHNLRAVQNLFRICPGFDRLTPVKALWEDGIHSAHQIKRMGRERFVEHYAGRLGRQQAEYIAANAEMVSGLTLFALARYAWDTNAITPYGIPRTDLSIDYDERARGVLSEIFGNLDFCHCEHCRSVLGPAAYLADLLLFLNNSTAEDGETGLEKLFARRPDLGNIKLNCDNSNTPLPYVDLVNEVLEDSIEPRTYAAETHEGTTVLIGEVNQTEETRPEYLQAQPEHLNPAAYDTLASASFPWTLPFSLWAEEARAYLAQLGVRRSDLMETFRGTGAPSPTPVDVFCEALGMTPLEHTLLTTAASTVAELRPLWGVRSGPVVSAVRTASSFLDRAKITYPQLEQILQCHFINPPDTESAIQISFDEDNPCSLDDAQLTNLSTRGLDRLHRFIRLRQKLNWDFFDLDKAFTAFDKETIDDDLLEELSLTIQLKERLGVGIVTTLSWWSSTMDTVEYKDHPSQYSELFQNRAMGALSDEVRNTLSLNAGGTELTGAGRLMTEPDYETVVLGAARIRKDDLALIVASDLAGDNTLNLASLSHVIRVASFTHAAGMPLNDYYVLKNLSGIAPLSFSGDLASPHDTRAFLETRETVAASGITLAELVYLLAHDTSQPNNGRPSEEAIAQRLSEIRADLAAIRAAHQMPDEELETVLAETLGELLEDDEPRTAEEVRTVMVLIVLGESPLAELDQKVLIQDHFASFVDAVAAGDMLVGPVNALGDDRRARLTYVLQPLLAHLYPLRARRHLEQKLAESVSLSVAAASAMLDAVTSEDGSQTATSAFLEEAFLTGIDPITRAANAHQFEVYERICKAARLIGSLKATPTDQAFTISQGGVVGWLDVNELPLSLLASGPALTTLFDRFVEMVRAFQFWPRIRTSGAPLAEFLTQANSPGATEAQIRQLLSDNTAWPLDDIETLTFSYAFGLDDLQSSAWLFHLYKAFSILKRVGVRAAQAWAWNTAEVTAEQATQIKFAVKSKYDAQEWLALAPALRDPLREKQRDALLAHVIYNGVAIDPLHPGPDQPRKLFGDADDVYAYLLIDPQMSACMDTSRIKQAIASVQLFVQRVLMNLEAEAGIEFTYADAKQWKWRKNYRVWEANRKVFLWPENWIYPDLRDDKSPFFKELESDLSQSDIDDNSAESALGSYLKKLDEVAQLEVSGLYQDAEQNMLHVFARTPSKPHKYYYRRQVNQQFWTAWERVEADIDGDGGHLIPVLHNRRLFLFWPTFTEKALQPSPEELTVLPGASEVTPADPRKYYEIRMAWTQLREGKWREVQVSTDYIATLEIRLGYVEDDMYQALLPRKEDLYFFAEQTPQGELLLRCRLLPIESQGFWNGQILYYNDVTDAVETYRPPADATGSEELGILFRNFQLNKLPDGDNVFMEFEKTTRERELALLTYAEVNDFGGVEPSTKTTKTLLAAAAKGYQLMLPHQYPTYISQAPIFYSDNKRLFFVEPIDVYWSFDGAGLMGAFDLPADSYYGGPGVNLVERFIAGAARMRTGLDILIKGNRPFFDSGALYYQGNKASGAVIQRVPDADSREGDFSDLGSMISTGLAEDGAQPLVIEDAEESAIAGLDYISLGMGRADLFLGLGILGWRRWEKKYRFWAFNHPYVPLMIKQLNRYGVAGLLAPVPDHGDDFENLKRQQVSVEDFASIYEPTDVVDSMHYPKEDFDFEFGGGYSQYNWELFFHVPLLIAERLTQNHRFEDAQKWFHYIFDPTETEGAVPRRFWKVKPFYNYEEETSIEKLLELLNEGDEEVEAQVQAWESDPFNPHLIARMRNAAYMRSVVMKYLDNLIGWGDSLFRQDTIESINEATQLYVLAAEILGRRPERIEKTNVSDYTFNELFPNLDEFANARVVVESLLPWMTTHRSDPSPGASGVLDTLYFCIPQNERLLGYWDTVADRLSKIRKCLNIEGVRRQLVLFEPPIDPGLLVKARAGGLDLSNVVSDSSAALPYYRFRVILQRAVEFCADVRALGSALLQALERRDESSLAMLRATHQIDLLTSLRALKEKAIDEATHTRKALDERQRSAEHRQAHYSDLAFMNVPETLGVGLSSLSVVAEGVALAADALASVTYLIPNFQIGASGFGGSPHVSVRIGGQSFGKSAESAASVLSHIATILDKGAGLAHTMAGYSRRQEEWDLQRDIAKKEVDDLKEQILAAGARLELARADLTAHDKQIEQAGEDAEFLESRFTSTDLYNWMATQVSGLYFQAYQMAYDLAKKAEQCFRYELGIRDTSFIQFGYWDSIRKGLLAGERLHKDLRRLEAAYLEMNRREFELTRHISLAQLNPLALLQLKQSGSCQFIIPEVIFDLDHPGLYMRRIKSVSLSLPCVVGPYTSVGAKLTMLENRTRISTNTTGGYTYTGLADPHFVHDLAGIQSIATSAGQGDAGLFELSFGDERYLPFEGAGVVSRWRLELPAEFRTFDYDTISDAILHVQYTARDGGDLLKTAVEREIRSSLNRIADILSAEETGLTRVISVGRELSTNWHQFMYPAVAATSQRISFALEKKLFPLFLSNRRIDIREIAVVLMLEDPSAYAVGSAIEITFVHPDGTGITGELVPLATMGSQPGVWVPAGFTLDRDPIEVAIIIDEAALASASPDLVESRDGKTRLSSSQVADVLFVINYTIAS